MRGTRSDPLLLSLWRRLPPPTPSTGHDRFGAQAGSQADGEGGMAVSSNRFWDRVCAGLDDAIAAWPPDRMTEEQKTAEMERMVRRGKAARAEADGMPPPWAVSLARRLDRIEDLLAEIAERRQETK